ncbi:hypothetical protein Tco_1050482 [Tanacetum coccineum]
MKDIWLGNVLSLSDQGMLHDPGIPVSQALTVIPHNAAFQTKDLDTYDSDSDDLLNAQAVLMANISNYGSDVILEVPNSETYLNDMDNQSVHALQDFEQSPVMDFTNKSLHFILCLHGMTKKIKMEVMKNVERENKRESKMVD